MKKLKLITSALLMTFALTACGGGSSKEVNVDVNKLAQTLSEETVTGETLTQANADMIPQIYALTADDIASAAAYTNSGSTAYDIAVVECKEADQAAEIEKQFNTYVQTRTDLFASYNQDEVKKLDDAVVKTAGKYVVLCVSDDSSKAKDVLKESGF